MSKKHEHEPHCNCDECIIQMLSDITPGYKYLYKDVEFVHLDTLLEDGTRPFYASLTTGEVWHASNFVCNWTPKS
jgi:hypothetical protein